MRAELRIGSAPSWVVAWLLALAAPVVYLAWPGDWTWWLAPCLALPLVGLAAWREGHKGRRDDHVGGADGSAWAPPADHVGGP